MKLLVLGNGFDLWLGLPTEFNDYKGFLEKNGNKYSNYYNLLRVIASKNQDYDWNRLEDDMLSWLIKKINKTNLLTELLCVDIKKTFYEKNTSLSEWINYINKKYKNELEQLQKFLKDRCPIIDNGAFIWTFNYMIDYYKPRRDNENKDLMIQTKIYDDVNRRMVSQCHFFAYNESIKDIKFGANYKLLAKKILNFDNIVKKYNDDDKCLIMALTKFCPLSIFINNKNMHEKLNNPIRNMYEDPARNLPYFLWTQEKQISEICSLGFSFGEQDDIYFSNEAKYSPLKYCINFKYTYYKDDERDKIKEKLKKYNCNANISEYKMDELLKDIFGNDGYNELCKIQSCIDKKNKSTDK